MPVRVMPTNQGAHQGYDCPFSQNCYWKDTGHCKGLSESVEGRPPSDLPRGNVSVHKLQFIKELPKLRRKPETVSNKLIAHLKRK